MATFSHGSHRQQRPDSFPYTGRSRSARATWRSPVNLHFVIEGEEEIGSGNLGNFLSQNKDALRSDVVVVSDTGMVSRGQPTMSYGLRGITALEIEVIGPKMDLHSGVFGGSVANPATALARLLATLHDDKGRVAVAGFYDRGKAARSLGAESMERTTNKWG
jgi:acetylornithine deacetylase/succinyl-diaminopimelate desuccinylase-like protein